ncbi:MAG: hypothetical protein E6356_16900 [Terrisporobacter othiniensis]|nr:hypothetical protein [Terrisporobacter othiniensis]
MSSVNFNNNKFNGKLGNKRAYDYYNNAKHLRCDTSDGMIECVKNILGCNLIKDKEFYDEFWEKIFLQNDEDAYNGGIKLNLNTTDNLYSESNIASTLELMGTLIIRSERKRDNPEQYIKVYHSREMFKKAIDEQNAIRHITENTSEGKYSKEKGLDDLFVLANQMNYKMEKRFDKLDDKHLEKLDKEYGSKYPQVHDYYIGYLNMKHILKEMNEIKKLRKLNKEENVKYKLIKKNVRSLKEDFLDCINKKARPIIFKAPLPDGGLPDWDEFDILDKEHIKYALYLTKGNDMQDDVSVIIRDLNNTINECKFTYMQGNVLELLREDKTQEDIGNILNITQPVVNKHIQSIVNKIYNKNLEKYTDWYFMNIRKGEYIKCSQCNEIKLVSQFDKNGSRGYMSMCKQCRKK